MMYFSDPHKPILLSREDTTEMIMARFMKHNPRATPEMAHLFAAEAKEFMDETDMEDEREDVEHKIGHILKQLVHAI
jgi:hypothetical protein